MEKKSNWQDFKAILDQYGITKLYHFTDRSNLESIIKEGGLYSWMDCDKKGIKIIGDIPIYVARDSVEVWVNPKVFQLEGRISNPVILEIDPEVIYWKSSKYSDSNATRNDVCVGENLDAFKKIHFNSVKARTHFDLTDEEKPYFQAEILVKNFIPLECIKNITNFGIPIPSMPKVLQSKIPYTAQITRNTPTAFIFLIDQSVAMKRTTSLNGETMSLAEAVARIVNLQINELVLRCVKMGDMRHYYDIAVIGYGKNAYSGWQGELEGRDFVSPEELKNHPYTRIITRKETRTRKGVQIKEVEQVQWVSARHDGSLTHVHKAFEKAKTLLDCWLAEHHEHDCYPPTIINITDGVFNGTTRENLVQQANELKAMFTNDGNILLWNIHITPDHLEQILLPVSKEELKTDKYSELLYDMSSLLPERYNRPISDLRGDNTNERHVAMTTNTDMSTLIQLMDIGTPTNISQNQ